MQSKGKYHYASLEHIALEVLEMLKKRLPDAQLEFCGQLRRRNTIVDTIEILCAGAVVSEATFDAEQLILESQQGSSWLAHLESGIPVHIHTCEKEEYGSQIIPLYRHR